MIQIRHIDTSRIIGVVVPAPHVEGMDAVQETLEQRITLSFNALVDIPLDALKQIGNDPVPLNALSRWLDQRRQRPH